MSLTIRDYLSYAGINLSSYQHLNLDAELSSSRTDSRLIGEGDVFFALQGENENGEKYVSSAIKRGAALVFVSESCELDIPQAVKVPDVYACFKKIAKSRLSALGCDVVAITGSVGKTSTRNFCYQVLSETFMVHKARANYNTATGIMMTIMDTPPVCDIMVLEMGVDTIGDMAELVDIANPRAAIITNIGEAHLERFGSREAIFREKSSISKNFTASSCLILRGGDEFLDTIKAGIYPVKRLYRDKMEVAESGSENYMLRDVNFTAEGTDFVLISGKDSYDFSIRQIGGHMAFDAAAAAIMGFYFGMSYQDIKNALLKSEMEKMRFELIDMGAYSLINDCYNSSFTSLRASLETFKSIRAERHIAVLGDILEIGENPALEHQKIGRYLSDLDLDYIYFYGSSMKSAYEVYKGKASHYQRDEVLELGSALKSDIREGDLIIFKASRSLALERVVDFLKSDG